MPRCLRWAVPRVLFLLIAGLGVITLPAAMQAQVIRADDQRVADVAFRLATAGQARCLAASPLLGFTLQHLGQFALADRAAAAGQYHLDRGPGVLAVVTGGPAARAGLLAGDVLLAIDGAPVPTESGVKLPFDQARARTRADAVDDLLDAAAAAGAVTLEVERDGKPQQVTIAPVRACPSRVHLARSLQRNAFADGRHVFVTTGILALASSDDELAFVIAHEMAHNILGHAARVRAVKASDGVAALIHRPAVIKETEREADLLGADLLLDAGYRIEGAESMLQALDTGWQGPTIFAEHDRLATRLAALIAHARARAGAQ